MGRVQRCAYILMVGVLAAPVSAGLAAGQKTVSASAGWVKAPATGETTAAAFAVIDNPTMYDVYVIRGAAGDVAQRVEFRESTGPSRDAVATSELTVPAFGALELKPGGTHLVLVDLKRPLKAGETVPLTLTTDGGVTIQVPAIVRAQ